MTPPEIPSNRDGSLPRGVKPCSPPPSILGAGAGAGSRLAAWVIDSAPPLDTLNKELGQVTQNIVQLSRILEQIESIPTIDSEITNEGFSPNVKKDRKKFGLRKKKSSKGSSVDLTGSSPSKTTEPESASPLSVSFPGAETCSFSGLTVTSIQQQPVTGGLSSSNTSLPTTTLAARPQSLPGPEHLLPLAVNAVTSINNTALTLCTLDTKPSGTPDNQIREDFTILAKDIHGSLKLALYTLVTERDRLKTALESDSTLLLNSGSSISSSAAAGNMMQKPLHASLSYSSSCVSASEFFDAEEYQLHQDGHGGRDGSDTSSEAGSLTSEEGSVSMAGGTGNSNMKCMTGRRTKLPAPRPDTEGLSLWNLLCKNIGKDLSQVSMPVALNEPLNMLQRMCEELEYSELLDKASEVDDPYERMVSHHPPISVCYAESRNFIFSQDARIKTKFWGKSMEFQPTGIVSVKLPRYSDQYQWNKVTTCVHNLFGGQRWVDQYGELRITNGRINCKLTFVKASYWSAKRHEVFGVITNEDGKVVRNLFGKWSEALYCGVAPSARCIWRPGTMPEEYEMYYGFTRFAMELNELDPDMSKYLPITDTRFRPDQRLLEEGNLTAAENLKLHLEQAQRDRRKRKEQDSIQHEPRWFSKCITSGGEETWEYNYKYWECRKSPGFVNMQFEALW
ncbi:Oxysterol-binding protein-related protein 6 [Blattella germanica]|nr:Oxysterol-binding protein-related protein 6 [Blattella germanica]